MSKVGITSQPESVESIIHIQVHSHLLCCQSRHRQLLRCPVRALHRCTTIIHIIKVAEYCQLRMVSCTQSKQARQIQVIICHTSIHIAQPANIILFLQVDIHHIFILLNLSFGKQIQVSFLFIYLDGVYRVCRQVLQEYRIITLEEILAIK